MIRTKGSPAGVDLLHGRREGQVNALFLQQRQVRVKRPGVAVQVHGIAELQRVDEDAGHHHVIVLDGGARQGGMAFVECPHGWHQSLGGALLRSKQTGAFGV
ncbi:hypothetical protein QFZ57_000745 [Arthrobacter sp. B1I2]|nr:hypothetical protein [Arthrobacter sp. B1I2]